MFVSKAPVPKALQGLRPAAPTAAPAVPAVPAVPPPAARPTRILIIDDDHRSSRTLTEALVADGHEVLPVRDGAFGLECMALREPDVVLLDLGLLPSMNGFRILEEARRRRLPSRVVVMTSSSVPHIGERARDLGAAAVLRKPASPHDVRAVLAELFGAP